MLYAFRCRTCGHKMDLPSRVPVTCPACGSLMGRDYSSVRFGSVLHGHFNHSVGSYVSGQRGFRDALARKSDEMAERTGIPCDYQPCDPTDRDALGVSPGWEYGDPV